MVIYCVCFKIIINHILNIFCLTLIYELYLGKIMSLSDKIFSAGIVGAGGAGFPTHVKSESEIEFVIANGAECEPLIHKDYELMVNFPEEIVNGLELMLDNTSARKSYFGIKSKNQKILIILPYPIPHG